MALFSDSQVGEIKTSLLMRLSNMTHHALRPFIADQRLFTNTRIDCDPIQTSLCYASYLNGSGWVSIFVGASDRARASSEVTAPHWPKIGDDVPGEEQQHHYCLHESLSPLLIKKYMMRSPLKSLLMPVISPQMFPVPSLRLHESQNRTRSAH